MALMRRQSLVKFDAPLCETIVDTPKPQGREVLVRIERCGLCHSDLHIQDGYADLGGGKRLDTTRGMTLPFTLGHEIAGIVEEVGPDVSKDLIGTKKAVFPWIGCGQCRDCLNGDENLCARPRFLGVNLDGGFDSRANRKCMFNAGMIPNIKENPRNRKTTKRGRKRFFNAAIHALRMRVERTFAWEDTFKRLLLRFERIQQRHYGMKLLAYTLINLRAFWGA